MIDGVETVGYEVTHTFIFFTENWIYGNKTRYFKLPSYSMEHIRRSTNELVHLYKIKHILNNIIK